MVTAVEVTGPVWVLEADGEQTTGLDMYASWRYDPADPYAVAVAFKYTPNDEDEVVWVFARDLLDDGLHAPTIDGGDVVVWPAALDRVRLRFSSPAGTMVIEVARQVISDFLNRSYAWVWKGQEPGFLNLDAALERLLTEAEG